MMELSSACVLRIAESLSQLLVCGSDFDLYFGTLYWMDPRNTFVGYSITYEEGV